jgi:hypothetical protein
VESAISLIEPTLGVPDHTTASSRAAMLPPPPKALPQRELHVLIDSAGLQVFTDAQWLPGKHDAQVRRCCRKLRQTL